MSLLNIFNIAGSALSAQAKKIEVISSNLANSDSFIEKNGKLYPYIAKKVTFTLDAKKGEKIGGVKIASISEDSTSMKMIYDPYNPIANSKGYVMQSNVNPITETVNNITTARNYQANIAVLKTVKSMIMKTLTLGE